jgi:hypothetical protein
MTDDICNTHDQLTLAKTGIAICWHGKHGRSPIGNYWSVTRYLDGTRRVTDPKPPWWGNKEMLFDVFTKSKKETLTEAQAWVATTYGEVGPWARNRQGDYVPKRINKEFPIRKD